MYIENGHAEIVAHVHDVLIVKIQYMYSEQLIEYGQYLFRELQECLRRFILRIKIYLYFTFMPLAVMYVYLYSARCLYSEDIREKLLLGTFTSVIEPKEMFFLFFCVFVCAFIHVNLRIGLIDLNACNARVFIMRFWCLPVLLT